VKVKNNQTITWQVYKSSVEEGGESTALLPEMTNGNTSFAIAGVLSDNSRFQSENDIKSIMKTTKTAL
jgi:hypothetical protein